MFKPTYLYVKTHNVTGLKYFGKTTNIDPIAYKGSGTVWKRHIKEYGYNVTTDIIGYFTDESECKIAAFKFSVDNNIECSDEWANLLKENLTGSFDYINKNGLNLEESWSEESIKRHREKSLVGSFIGGGIARDEGLGIFSLSKEQQLQNSKKGRDVIREKYGVESIFSILNKDTDFNDKKKKIFKDIGHQQGSKNSQFGSMWITNEIENRKIDKNSTIPDGWRKGRVIF